MKPAALAIRAERPRDRAAIHALLRAAFGAAAEADLVDQLREDGTVVLSLVAEEEGAIVGHVLYSRLAIDGDGDGASALAPVAVLPERQNRGVGSRLIEAAHATLASSGEKLVFVLGDPQYYGRFGFSAEQARGFRTPYDGEYMMALALTPDARETGVVEYSAPLARLG